MRFEDCDEGDYTEEEIEEIIKQMSIPIGEVRFLFVKQFRGGAVYNGRVTRIIGDKRVCEFGDPNDNKRYNVTIAQAEKFSWTQLMVAESDDDDESEDDNDDGVESVSDSDDGDVEEVLDDSNVNIDGNPTTATPTPTHNVANKKDGAKYLRKHITSLTTVPPVMDTK